MTAVNIDVRLICEVILNIDNVSHIRLQKLLYFIQGQFLMDTGEPCFRNRIEAWKIGPVVPEVYEIYKYYGGASISKEVRSSPLPQVVINKIEKIMKESENYSTGQLISISRIEGAPWSKAYKAGVKAHRPIARIRLFSILLLIFIKKNVIINI